jgi:ubiquinone biosynthesis protein COQ4
MRILSALRSYQNPEFVKTDLFQRSLLTLGSGLGSIFDPSRDDLISAFGDLTSSVVLPNLRNKMLADPEGSRILSEKPLINSRTVDLSQLAKLPANTFGKKYVDFLEQNEITPDSRRPVLFIEDLELAYVLQRYRQIHDFTHCILGTKIH